MNGILDKFVLLMWKNFILQIRNPCTTATLLILPILLCYALVLLRSTTAYKAEKLPAVFYPAFDPIAGVDKGFITILYSPISPNLTSIMNKTAELLNVKAQGMPDAASMEKYVKEKPDARDTIVGAVQFEDSLSGFVPLPKNLYAAIRFPDELRKRTAGTINKDWKTHLMFPQMQIAGPRNPRDKYTASPGYYQEGFLAVQVALSLALLESLGASMPSLQMQRFPYPEYTDTSKLLMFGELIGLLLIICFMQSNDYIIKSVTLEKERQIKEMLKIMGLPNWLHWSTWFLEILAILSLSAIVIAAMLTLVSTSKSKAVCDASSPLVIFMFLFSYVCSLITFAFLTSTFFSKANTAAAFGDLVFFLTYIPFLFVNKKYDVLTLTTKLLTCLGINSALCLGFFLIIMREASGEGAQLNNIWKTISPDDGLTLGAIMVMLIIESILFMVIALYIEAVFPGSYGIPLPWYFPFTVAFWCGQRNVQVEDVNDETSTSSSFIEKEPTNLPIGINIKNLHRTFGHKAAVAGISLNMYEGQITALLGHNGAGKTTTMSMLTGLIPPTAGTAYIRGYSIRNNMEKVRESLGLCPQNTVLFDNLTVEEHIYFFCMLKGLNKKQVNNEVQRYAKSLELLPKLKEKTKNLSGGMQRKVNVIIALCGNSKVVMLDEPTAGMDPSARRSLWDLLLLEKHGRTVLLTTHFMEEADLLGDRIAIMAGGRIQCCGSSFFLKKKYGAGYILIMDKSESCVPSRVTSLLKQYIPSVEIETNIGSELTYVLNEKYLPVFEEMLRNLEENSGGLGIRSYGISLTTLEQVFMKVGADYDLEEAKRSTQAAHSKPKSLGGTPTLQIEHGELYTGWQLWKNQLLAMFLKKVVYIMRSWILFLIHIILPIAMAIVAMASVRSGHFEGGAPERELSLDSYHRPVTVVSGSGQYKQAYIDILKENDHLYEDIGNKNMSEYIHQKTIDETAKVRERYILATIFNNKSITALFNNEPYHSPPLALSMVINSAIRSSVGSSYNIRFTNYPLQFRKNSTDDPWDFMSDAGTSVVMNMVMGMAFVSAFYVFFYVKERVIKAKHLQFLSGVGVFMFWGTSVLYDLMSFLVIVALILVTVVAFQVEGYKSFDDIGHFFLLLLLFGYSMLPLQFLGSYISNIPATCYGIMTAFNIVTGIVLFLMRLILSRMESTEKYADIMHKVFLIFPHYSLSSGMQNNYDYSQCEKIAHKCIEEFYNDVDKCREFACAMKNECCGFDSHFSWDTPGVGRIIAYFLATGTIFFIILLALESVRVRNVFYHIMNSLCSSTKLPSILTYEDDDVAKERSKIYSADNAALVQYAVVLEDVTKYYMKCVKNFLAVNRLCLGVKDYECFGLLGVNGAGKTTTFRMMTGDTRISYGKVFIGGFNINKDSKKAQKLIGYCPQFDAILEDMTGYETLLMFCLIRGIGLSESKMVAPQLAKELDFDKHLHKRVKHYSGGNKRKLSTALALIGDPPILYFDEPTTGMDPATKRFVWNALCKIRDSGKCIILTTHNMEECEALCTRIAIMVNGTFKCLGSTQRLKSRFSEGFTLTIKTEKPADDTTLNLRIVAIEKFVLQNFPSAVLQEKYQELMSFYIKDRRLPWSRMFGIMEANKKRLTIEDYSLGQCSLEQVFLSFTKFQRPERR